MKTTEEFAREMIESIEDIAHEGISDVEWKELESDIAGKFQLALDTPVPMSFVDGFVPCEKEENGYYWYEIPYGKKRIIVKLWGGGIWIDRKWYRPSQMPGRFSHRLISLGEEE